MSKVFLIFLFVFFVQDNEPFLVWSESNKLTWEDFIGLPDMGETAVANTASGITFGYSVTKTDKGEVVSFTTEVNAHFYPEKSWYKKKRASSHILGHEQTHFNITELFARKFRYRISLIQVSDMVKEELKLLFKKNNTELDAMQKKYDSDTSHSRHKDAQAQWDKYINAELEKYSEFK